MTTITNRAAALAGLTLLAVALLPAAEASHPIGTEDRARIHPPTACSDEGRGWEQLKVDGNDLKNGPVSDGELTVTIEFTHFNSEGEPIVVDWREASGPVAAIFVKGGPGARYVGYEHPGGMEDTGLTTGEDGRAISFIAFCYDSAVVPIPELASLVLAGTGLLAVGAVALFTRRRS